MLSFYPYPIKFDNCKPFVYVRYVCTDSWPVEDIDTSSILNINIAQVLYMHLQITTRRLTLHLNSFQ